MNRPRHKPAPDEGAIVDSIFKLSAQLNPGQRTAVAYAILTEATIVEFAAQLHATRFPKANKDLILAVVRATIQVTTPPPY